MSLKKQAFSGFVWTFTSNLGTKFTTLVVGVILARLLAPSDFGLIAMLYFFFEVSRVLVDSGFSQAIIREKEINEEDKSTVFYISLFTAVICYIALWIGAPAIARFYEEPQLTLLTRVMGLNLIFASFTIVQNAVLINELKFKT
ncbi:MAG TPA: oligosaccharide flippase family protein, partial [Chitinophagales bacterium]|nr:oligosaccharide flippase family protein [Chitinophagales bacterium]